MGMKCLIGSGFETLGRIYNCESIRKTVLLKYF